LEAPKRFVVTGNSRLTVAVARQLSARGGHVTVVDVGGEGTIARRLQADVRPRRRLSLRALLGAAEGRFEPGIHVASAGEDLQASLQAVALAGATCLLALSDHDEENLLVGLAGSEVAPSVPLVLQTFDPALADQLEQVEREVTVRRALTSASMPLRMAFLIVSGMMPCSVLNLICASRRRAVSSIANFIAGVTVSA